MTLIHHLPFRRWAAAGLFWVGLVVLPAVAGAQGKPVFVFEEGQAPELNTETTVVQGEKMYSEFEYPLRRTARLVEDYQMWPKEFYPAGTELVAFERKKGPLFCRRLAPGMALKGWGCLVPHEDPSKQVFVRKLSLLDIGMMGNKLRLKEELPFELDTEPVEPELWDHLKGTGAKFYSKEILYQGAAGGILRLGYREYVNDLARPAFSQELTYDLPDLSAGPLVIAVKGVRLEIHEAGNSGIRYRVLSPFET